MAKILIKNGHVWDGDKFFYSDVLTNDGLISSIAPDIDESADYVYDASEKVVSPGLVDIHTHMLGIYGINAELSCIPFGVTAAADAGSVPDSLEKYNNFLVKNKVFVCCEIKNNRVIYENTARDIAHYKDKAIGIKVYFDTTLTEVYDISPLEEIVNYAHENGLIVMVHSSNSPTSMAEIVSALKPGDILTHTFHPGKNNASEDCFECLRLAKKKGVITDAGFAGNVHTDFSIFNQAISSGCIPDTISTDITRFSAYKRGGRYGMTMCMSIAKKLGMNEEDIFRCVTSSPAKALGKNDEWGSLSPGRCADISVFDYSGEPFSLTDKAGNTVSDSFSYNCVLCVSSGEIVFRK
ncbi:MAG: amidohydrolase family protein [Clostridia bacterium]|nr:amidohydrolase family protein [Clostridia bacterium]